MNKKETIYIDVEDDITAIIEKVKKSDSKVVALVPPKRSAVLESIVNVKLLKRLSSENEKQVVIVSSDKKLVSLAGAVGLYVASNLKSKPELPKVERVNHDDDLIIDGEEMDLHPQTSVGELDAAHNEDESAEDDLPEEDSEDATAADGDSTSKEKDKTTKASTTSDASKEKKKGIKVPNFEAFRSKLLLIGGVFVLLLIGLWYALVVLPKGTIDIYAQTSPIDTAFDFTVDASRSIDDIENKVIGAESQEISKSITETFDATGTKEIGESATGSVTVTNCENNTGVSVGAGSVLTSSSGLGFITSTDLFVPGSNFSGGGTVCDESGFATVSVVAEAVGSAYNINSESFSVSGLGNVFGLGSSMDGGSSETLSIVSQSDVDSAVARLLDRDDADIKAELISSFSQDVRILEDSYNKSSSTSSSSPAIGEEASTAQVTVQVTYTQLAISNESLDNLVDFVQASSIDVDTKQIVDSGLEGATLKVKSTGSLDTADYSFISQAFVGPKIDTDELAEQVAGKRFSETKSVIEAIEGVNSVEIDYSPFWVSKTPKASRTTINLLITERE